MSVLLSKMVAYGLTSYLMVHRKFLLLSCTFCVFSGLIFISSHLYECQLYYSNDSILSKEEVVVTGTSKKRAFQIVHTI